MKRSGNGRESGCGKRRNALGCPRRGERQGANQNPLCQLDLEEIVSRRFGIGERRLRRASESVGTGTEACEALFGCPGAPRFGGNAAEREPCVPDRALFDPQSGG